MGVSAAVAEAVGEFAAEVGSEGPVAAVGSGSRQMLGGPLEPGTRRVAAPAGIIEHHRSELTVTVTAGTELKDLEAVLAEVGQTSGLIGNAASARTTVGSAVATGTGGLHTLANGPMRDFVLGIRAVDAAGRAVAAGGATVKNVSGYDLCRLWTGSLGTLVLIAAVTLRTRPLRPVRQWIETSADPFRIAAEVAVASSVLWDGSRVWVHLAGEAGDVEAARTELEARSSCEEVAGPPRLPAGRLGIDPARLVDWRHAAPLDGPWVAEVGVGLVHTDSLLPPTPAPPRVVDLHNRIKERFDPHCRLAPGRSVLAASGAVR